VEDDVRPDERQEVSGEGRETIFALSSGQPPAAIAVVRISGPGASGALVALAGRVPEPRRTSLAQLRHPHSGELLDHALLIWFPGPRTATGEDLAELHLHGGRSVVAAVLEALDGIDGLRRAEPGEFTRRAFANGRIDLAEAEGLADLLAAETETQRRAALSLAGGALSRKVEEWRGQVLELAAMLEAVIDFSDEGEVSEEFPSGWHENVAALAAEIGALLRRPTVERLRDGIRVSITGPPNVGKSSLLNVLVGREAAITSAVAGTTRDLVEAPIAIGGTPFLLIDTAGIRDSADKVESIGVERARASMDAADLILWLGDVAEAPDSRRTIAVSPKADLGKIDPRADIAVSSLSGEGIDALVDILIARARDLLPAAGDVAVNRRHRDLLADAVEQLDACGTDDLLIAAEALRHVRQLLDRITGRAGVEDMLDALFGRFCIGK
jgi:tRNA modification GTPase